MPIIPSTQYRDNFQTYAPPWLATGNAEKYLYTLELCRDLLLDKMNQAIKIRLPGQGDVSQIPYLANDRVLVQGPAEPNASFIARLQGAFAAWKKAGSRVAVLEQLQAYLQLLQPGVAINTPELTIVAGNASTTTWSSLFNGDALGAQPRLMTVPVNFNWDGKFQPWRSWLILYMHLVSTAQSGTGATTGTPFGGSVLGQNVAGVWVPGTSGTPVNAPFVELSGLSGLVAGNAYQWITITGAGHAANDGLFQIQEILSATQCVICNPNAVGSDSGLAWSISQYPFIAPGPVWSLSNGFTLGQGELLTPPLDTGSNVGGVWQPTTLGATYGPSLSWGLSCPATTIQSIRQILKAWKSASTFYPYIVVAFDGGDGTAGNAYSPESSEGSGNPDGTFGGHGKNVAGVWTPNRLITSPYDAYCQGTGTWNACSVQNVT